MTDPLVPTGDGHTPLSDEDRQGLIPTFVATRGDLNAAEQANISRALRRQPPATDELLDDAYLRNLHRAMFGDVWTWAGVYRTVEVTIGVDPARIAVGVRNLVDNARAWVTTGAFPPDELAVRLHHGLVAIHPFINGNGRHGRIVASYLVRSLGELPFTWGAGVPGLPEELRSDYIAALRAPDHGEFSALLSFSRS